MPPRILVTLVTAGHRGHVEHNTRLRLDLEPLNDRVMAAWLGEGALESVGLWDEDRLSLSVPI